MERSDSGPVESLSAALLQCRRVMLALSDLASEEDPVRQAQAAQDALVRIDSIRDELIARRLRARSQSCGAPGSVSDA